MNNFNFTTKLLLIIVAISGTLWLGSYTVKIFSFFNLFYTDDTGELIAKEIFQHSDITTAVYSLLPVLITSIISYYIFIISSILFISASKLSLKHNGWLFIALVIVVFNLPFETILNFKDYKIIQMILKNSTQSNNLLEIIQSRISLFSSLPVVSLILYFSIIILIIFKPLTKKIQDEN